MNEKIFVTQPSIPPYEEYTDAIKCLWESHYLTNMGPYHNELEKQLKDYLDVKEISLMVNGHMSLEIAIQAFDFPKGSEVITTPFTFISTTHAIVRNNLTPVFCDVKYSDGTIDETKIQNLITDKTVAILPTHVYGNTCNIEEIQKIANRYNLRVIYDSAHAFGVKYKGRGIGSYGDASIFSFHATKVFNTIEGGAITFSDKSLYDKFYNLKNFGIRGEEQIVSIGANAKMNEFQSIMGLCNLKHIDKAIQRRKNHWDYYNLHIKNLKGIRTFKISTDANQNYAYYPILLENEYPMNRDELCNLLREHDIYPRKYFYPITADQECYVEQYGASNLPIARKLARQVLLLPLYENLTNEQIDRITKLI